MFKRNGCVYTEIVSDCSKTTLQGIIRGRVALDSVIYSDGWRGYNDLVDLKECEFRFNQRRQDLYPILLKLCRRNPLF